MKEVYRTLPPASSLTACWYIENIFILSIIRQNPISYENIFPGMFSENVSVLSHRKLKFVTEEHLFNHEEKQRDCPLLDANT